MTYNHLLCTKLPCVDSNTIHTINFVPMCGNSTICVHVYVWCAWMRTYMYGCVLCVYCVCALFVYVHVWVHNWYKRNIKCLALLCRQAQNTLPMVAPKYVCWGLAQYLRQNTSYRCTRAGVCVRVRVPCVLCGCVESIRRTRMHVCRQHSACVHIKNNVSNEGKKSVCIPCQ